MTRDIRYIDEGFLVWIIPSTYLSHKAVNWVCTAGVAVFAFIRFYIRFLVYDHYYIITAYIPLCHLCSIPLVSCSYLIIPWVFPVWYHLLSIYLLLCVCAYDAVFNACLWFGFIDTRVLIYARHLAFAIPLVGEFWLPWILMSRSRSLELVDSLGCWLEWHSENVDHRQTVWSSILPGFLARLSNFLSWLVSAICTVYDCISLYSRICAYQMM